MLTAILLLLGSSLAAIGSFGLVRLRSFYERVHAPTLGTRLSIGRVLAALTAFFCVSAGRMVLHELLIGALMIATTAITLMLLVRATQYRDRREGNADVPTRNGKTAA